MLFGGSGPGTECARAVKPHTPRAHTPLSCRLKLTATRHVPLSVAGPPRGPQIRATNRCRVIRPGTDRCGPTVAHHVAGSGHLGVRATARDDDSAPAADHRRPATSALHADTALRAEEEASSVGSGRYSASRHEATGCGSSSGLMRKPARRSIRSSARHPHHEHAAGSAGPQSAHTERRRSSALVEGCGRGWQSFRGSSW